MADKDLAVVDPPPNPAAADQPHPPSDLDVGRSEAPLVGPNAHKDLPGPETSAPCRSAEPSKSSPPVEISSSSRYEEEAENTGHWIASPLGSSSSESMPILPQLLLN